jgi:hypothetical protein
LGLTYADKVDPLARLREEIEKTVRQREGEAGQGKDHAEADAEHGTTQNSGPHER